MPLLVIQCFSLWTDSVAKIRSIHTYEAEKTEFRTLTGTFHYTVMPSGCFGFSHDESFSESFAIRLIYMPLQTGVVLRMLEQLTT